MAGESVLIVDDNPVNTKLVVFLLAKRGYDVRTASDASGALAAIRTRRPDLILMDVQLPGMDGLELTRQLKADPSTSSIAIVAVTAFAMTGDERKALEAGCDAYISKPIDNELLRARVAEILTRHSERDA